MKFQSLIIFLSITYVLAAPAPQIDVTKATAVGSASCIAGGTGGLILGAPAGPAGMGLGGAIGCAGGFAGGFAGSVISDGFSDTRRRESQTFSPAVREQQRRQMQAEAERVPQYERKQPQQTSDWYGYDPYRNDRNYGKK